MRSSSKSSKSEQPIPLGIIDTISLVPLFEKHHFFAELFGFFSPKNGMEKDYLIRIPYVQHLEIGVQKYDGNSMENLEFNKMVLEKCKKQFHL